MWSVSSNVDISTKLSEWEKLSNIALVPGSLEEEWLFSKLAYIKKEHRNRMEEEQQNVCLVLATHFWEFQVLPIMAAVQKWLDAKLRRPALYGRWRQPRQQQVNELSSDPKGSNEEVQQ